MHTTFLYCLCYIPVSTCTPGLHHLFTHWNCNAGLEGGTLAQASHTTTTTVCCAWTFLYRHAQARAPTQGQFSTYPSDRLPAASPAYRAYHTTLPHLPSSTLPHPPTLPGNRTGPGGPDALPTLPCLLGLSRHGFSLPPHHLPRHSLPAPVPTRTTHLPCPACRCLPACLPHTPRCACLYYAVPLPAGSTTTCLPPHGSTYLPPACLPGSCLPALPCLPFLPLPAYIAPRLPHTTPPLVPHNMTLSAAPLGREWDLRAALTTFTETDSNSFHIPLTLQLTTYAGI